MKVILIIAAFAAVLSAQCYTECGPDGCKTVCITDDIK
jgi:hypothetical protein